MRIAILDYKDAVSSCVTGPTDIWSGLNRMYPLVTGMPLKESIGIDFITTVDGKLAQRPMGSTQSQILHSQDQFRLIIIPAMRYGVRIEAAKKLLKNTRESIENIALQCGYEDISFFRKIFRRQVNMTPKEYHLKYGKLSVRVN